MATMKSLTKSPAFGVPSPETATRIDDGDAANAACAAHFRFSTRMRELEAQFEGKASELRAAFLAELRIHALVIIARLLVRIVSAAEEISAACRRRAGRILDEAVAWCGARDAAWRRARAKR
jgi:hypothetical protein